MKTKKRALTAGIIVGFFFCGILIAFAATLLFKMKDEDSHITPIQIFDFSLMTEMQDAQIGPGDVFSVKPIVKSEATESMYVFIKLTTPLYGEGSLYTFEVDPSWVLVEEHGGVFVYAYGQSELMTVIYSGETTAELTTELTMKDIPIEEYAEYDDLNINVAAYAIGTEGISADPEEAWTACKTLM